MTGDPFVSRRLSLLPGGQPVVLEIQVPRERRDGEWTCAFRVRGLGRVRTGRVLGEDGIQALQLALAAARRELEPFAGRLTWAGEPGELGLPECVPDYFGGAFRRRIEAMLHRESAAEASRLRQAATGKGRAGSPERL